MPEATPMMRQYYKIKEKHNDCILFFRLGDFYEMFNEDAKLASKELELTLTTRDRNKENPDDRVPMCGVPFHSAQTYIARLIAKGYKIAICEQLEDPATAKGLVDRDVIRIITPGTVTDHSMLDEGKSNYICGIYLDNFGGAVCFIDISTGEVCLRTCNEHVVEHISNEIARFAPVEAILNEGAASSQAMLDFLSTRLFCMCQKDDKRFDGIECENLVLDQFNAQNLGELGLKGESAAVRALGGLLSYIKDTQKTDLSHINSIDFSNQDKYMELDYQTVRSLELVSLIRTNEKKGSLLWVLDKTKTPMGARLLRSWITRPLLDPTAIKRRQNGVNELVNDNVCRSELMLAMKSIGDLERISGKVVCGSVNPRDLEALGSSISVLPKLKQLLAPMKSNILASLALMDDLSDIGAIIENAIGDEPPFSVREGGFIRPGFNSEVDRLRGLLDNSAAALADIEAREKARTGKKLKIGFNKVFGYYIEMPRAAAVDAPGDYIRKQTLVNCERFITQELKELENELLTAKDRLNDLEYKLFCQLRSDISDNIERIQQSAGAIAALDVLCSFAQTAVDNNYCMPEIDTTPILEIHDGRHPVVELTQTSSMFVPNDVMMGSNEGVVSIITGPNMAGKSTYMRQTALIVLMAQMGSFVPAKYAHVGIVDRVFTRIGASDDLSAGMSTFMVEMTEVADILKNATSHSLLILDEIGRGTSTYDGMSVARAVLEYCSKKIGAKTMFATHYHELTDLEALLPGVKNYNITAKKRGKDIIFLRKIVPGCADDSYGIEVAALAGVPDSVTRRAKEILKSLDRDAPAFENRAPSAAPQEQMTMEQLSGGEIADILQKTDINTLTPIEALNLLYELKKKL